MSLEAISSALITHLTPLGDDQNLDVIDFPSNPDELHRPKRDRVIVGFSRESLTPPSTTSFSAPIIQPRTLDWNLYIQIRDLRGHKQSNPRLLQLMDLIRADVTGFHPEVETAHWFYQTSGSFVQLTEAFWLYAMNFSILCPYAKHRR